MVVVVVVVVGSQMAQQYSIHVKILGVCEACWKQLGVMCLCWGKILAMNLKVSSKFEIIF